MNCNKFVEHSKQPSLGEQHMIITSKRHFAWVVATSVTLLAPAALTPAHGVGFDFRQSFYDIRNVSPDAGTARTRYDITLTSSSGGPLQTLELFLKLGAFDGYAAAAGTTISPDTPVPPSTVHTVDGFGPGTSVFLGYKTNNGPTLADSWTISSVESGFKAIRFDGGGFGFLDLGGTFEVVIDIEGDWSAPGVPGGHLFLGMNPAFTVVRMFEYDPFLNRTTFAAVNSAFDNTPPNVVFALLGSPVATPTVGSAGAMATLLGLLGVVVARRRTRSRA